MQIFVIVIFFEELWASLWTNFFFLESLIIVDQNGT